MDGFCTYVFDTFPYLRMTRRQTNMIRRQEAQIFTILDIIYLEVIYNPMGNF